MPGDKLVLDDLSLSFIVDEDLSNWLEIWTWIRDSAKTQSPFKDVRVHTRTNKNNINKTFVYKYAFPYNLSGFDMLYTAPPDTPVVCNVSFKYADIDIS